jgi:hypothetical protein
LKVLVFSGVLPSAFANIPFSVPTIAVACVTFGK